jgi:hypothetical protein
VVVPEEPVERQAVRVTLLTSTYGDAYVTNWPLRVCTTSVYYESGEETLLSLILLYVCGTTSGFSGTSRGCIYYRRVVGCSGNCYIHSTLHSVSALTRTDKHRLTVADTHVFHMWTTYSHISQMKP